MYSQAEQLPHLTAILTALKRKLVYSKTVKNTYYNRSTTAENFIYLQTSSSWKAQLFLQQKKLQCINNKTFSFEVVFLRQVPQSSHPISSRETKVVYWDTKRCYMYHFPFLFEILTLAFGKVCTFL